MTIQTTGMETSLLMKQFLGWIAHRPRTYSEVLEAWRSSCPRQCVWEDALADALVQIERGATIDQSRVTLTARGSCILHG
jgi:hypothetical protein